MKSRFLLVLALAPALAGADDLVQVYRDAQNYDAVYSAARYSMEAGRERLPQGRALLLPTLGLAANSTRSQLDFEAKTNIPGTTFNRPITNNNYTLTLSQPIYRPQNYAQYSQADYQVKQAEATFGQAGQDLAVRTAQAYFDVLAAEDTLALVGAQKAAISEQLAQAKRNFEVGTATITDTHEAQARYDLNISQEIAAQNDLANKRQSLQLITGKEYLRLTPLRTDVKLPPPNPTVMQTWVEMAERQSYTVQVQDAVAETAQLEMRRASAGHKPTLDVVATYGQTVESASATTNFGRDTTTQSIGLQLAVPLYQGGSVNSREREAAANYNKARDDLQAARRTAALTARQNYVSVVNGIAQVGALEQALVSSQSALDSNRLGYEVGVRINIDVLNAQQQLFSARRDLAVARYNTITSLLKLKSAAGTLRDEDMEEVNRVLAR
ncbi:MAG TPA: TolC family outer membrane protein [Burkholderiales bacterium]